MQPNKLTKLNKVSQNYTNKDVLIMFIIHKDNTDHKIHEYVHYVVRNAGYARSWQTFRYFYELIMCSLNGLIAFKNESTTKFYSNKKAYLLLLK